jgi:hypothetical protein
VEVLHPLSPTHPLSWVVNALDTLNDYLHSSTTCIERVALVDDAHRTSSTNEQCNSLTNEQRDSLTNEQRDSLTNEQHDSLTNEQRDSLTNEQHNPSTHEQCDHSTHEQLSSRPCNNGESLMTDVLAE